MPKSRLNLSSFSLNLSSSLSVLMELMASARVFHLERFGSHCNRFRKSSAMSVASSRRKLMAYSRVSKVEGVDSYEKWGGTDFFMLY